MATPVDQTQAPKGMVYSSFVRLQHAMHICGVGTVMQQRNAHQHARNFPQERTMDASTHAHHALVDDCDLFLVHSSNSGVEHQVDAFPADIRSIDCAVCRLR